MLDVAKEIVDYWETLYYITVVEETDKIYYYNKGVFILFTDTKIKNLMKMWISETNKTEEKPIIFSTTLFNQVKNNLYGNMSKLDDFDKHEYRVNCLNGIVDLRDGYFYEHLPFNETPYKSFIQIPVEYKKGVKCPKIIKFILDVFGLDRVAFIYEIISYILYRSNKLQKAFIFFGEAASGKTTFIELIRVFLGEKNIQDISIQKINKRFQMGNIRNKLANIYDDLPIQKLLYIQNFKQIVTNKTLTSELKGIQELVTWSNYCKQIYTTNNLPEVGEHTGDDFWRRIILVHCTNFFDNGTKDFDIGNKITHPDELSGLLNMCVHHFKDLHERKHFPERFDNIDTVKGIWLININPMKLFLDECCVITNSEDDYEEADFFRAQVNAFRKERNAEGISMNMITRKLKDLGVEKKQKSVGKRYYIGIKVVKTIIDKIDRILIGGQKTL